MLIRLFMTMRFLLKTICQKTNAKFIKSIALKINQEDIFYASKCGRLSCVFLA